MPEDALKRRRFPRIATEHVVLVSKAGPEELEDFAKMHSLGLGGCMFVSNDPLGEESIVSLLVSIGTRVVPAKARVVYQLALTGGGYEIGVEFVHLDEQDRQFLETVLNGAPGEA